MNCLLSRRNAGKRWLMIELLCSPKLTIAFQAESIFEADNIHRMKHIDPRLPYIDKIPGHVIVSY
jgi:hypothetical protein